MYTCTIGGKKYKQEKCTARALYEMGDAQKVLQEINAATRGESSATDLSVKDAMDKLLDWFCLFFGNQFTRDDVLDNYPSDSIIEDIVMCMAQVSAHVSDALTAFPTRAATRPPKKKKTWLTRLIKGKN